MRNWFGGAWLYLTSVPAARFISTQACFDGLLPLRHQLAQPCVIQSPRRIGKPALLAWCPPVWTANAGFNMSSLTMLSHEIWCSQSLTESVSLLWPKVMPDGVRPAGADRTLYALHPIPLSDVKAVRKHAPSWGTQHVVLVLNNGLTLPPLYFAHSGVKALFSALKEVRLSDAAASRCRCTSILHRPGHMLPESPCRQPLISVANQHPTVCLLRCQLERSMNSGVVSGHCCDGDLSLNFLLMRLEVALRSTRG